MKRTILIIFVSFFLFPLSNNTLVQSQEKSASLPNKETSYEKVKKEYKNSKKAIGRLEKEIDKFERVLKNKRDGIKTIELMIMELENQIENKEIEKKIRKNLRKSLRNFKKEKIAQETELHLLEIRFNIESDKTRKELQDALKKKETIEIELQSLTPVEIPLVTLPILNETYYKLQSSIISIEGKVFLSSPDDIEISLVLERNHPSLAFCEVYVNNDLAKRVQWKISSAKNFKLKIRNKYDASFVENMNDLKIVLKTYLKEPRTTTNFPAFKQNPLVVFKESTIGSKSLVSAKFELKTDEN